MAQNSSSAQDDLSDLIPAQPAQSSSAISPYDILAAQHELKSGNPPQVGGPIHQLGMKMRQTQKSPIQTQQIMPNPVGNTSPANPAGAAGSTQGDPSQGQSPALSKLGALYQDAKNSGGKSPSASLTDESQNKNGNTSSIKVGSEPGTYSRGVGEAEGYDYAKNADGTYTKSDKPDPNAPFQKQQSALDQLQKLVADRAARGQPERPADLSGLMMASDYLNHTDTFGKDYKNQQQSQEQALQDKEKEEQQLYSDQAGALKEQGDLYKQAQAGALGIMGGGQVGSVNQILSTQKALESVGKGNVNQGKLTDSQFDQMAGKLTQQGQTKDGSLNDLARMLSLGNPTADNLAAIAAAKSMAGTSRINVQEIQKFNNPDQSLWGRVDQILGRAANGQYNPEDRAQLMQMYQALSKGRNAEAQANMSLIHNMNDTQRINPQEHALIQQLYGHAMQPNLGNTNFNLGKAGAPHHTTPVTPGQNYDGSTPIPAGATPAMKQARIKFLQSKGGH